jgi:hypothetical protein
MTDAAVRKHRLHALCPYFAMFPESFARDSILKYTLAGELVLDPFSGRGTTLLEALLNDRDAIASDINPVAYCVSAAKAETPSLPRIIGALNQLQTSFTFSSRRIEREITELPTFFRRAFHPETLRTLVFLRSALQWRRLRTHRFITALILGHLHGECNRSPHYLSNQMPHSISTKPDYSIRYWRENRLNPPHRNVFELLLNRARFRLADGIPLRHGKMKKTDARKVADKFARYYGKVAAVITSPPYLDVTRFEEDQWLRLWFLGGPPQPSYGCFSTDDRHRSRVRYWSFLTAAWKGISPLLKKSAVLVCRIGARNMDPKELQRELVKTIQNIWPAAGLLDAPSVTPIKNRQARILHPDSSGCGKEIDFVFEVNRPKSRSACYALR